MMPRRFGPANSLMQVAAAVVGTAAASQVIHPGCPVVSGPCPGDANGRICSRPCDPDQEDQTHEHTYQTDLPQGAYGNGHPAQQDIVGANGRRLILRWTPEGVYVGGCLITDREVAESMARFITREDES